MAKNACTGDWLFYLQGDEVVHERYLDKIRATCEQQYERSEVEGFSSVTNIFGVIISTIIPQDVGIHLKLELSEINQIFIHGEMLRLFEEFLTLMVFRTEREKILLGCMS